MCGPNSHNLSLLSIAYLFFICCLPRYYFYGNTSVSADDDEIHNASVLYVERNRGSRTRRNTFKEEAEFVPDRGSVSACTTFMA